MIFKLSELVKLYTRRLQELKVELTTRVYSTGLKERILSQFEDMHAYTKGREVYLAHDNAVGKAVKALSNIQYDEHVYILAQATRIARRSMKDTQNFQGSFDPNFQKDAFFAPLFEIVLRILRGCSTDNTNPAREQAALTIAQLIELSTTFRSQNKSSSTSNYHLTSREPPLPIYLGTLIHSKTLIDKLDDLGISISYDRVLSISTKLANKIIDQFNDDKVVCPPSLKVDAFTTAATDNIDHNPSSDTSTSSFHGIAISIKGSARFSNKTKEIEKTAILLHRHKTSDLEQDNHYPGA